ncbi:YesL family protein [Lapidilactobacillus mulanensis]|uniref:YesL family protein n=1 Tax=Lapidilactobacillus mulanensis TaxID=2485999 RepID=A0ABW4DU89_9LACO|nr:DUF624 domain-containing protein [Lapidilactobacillus mulanensis]
MKFNTNSSFFQFMRTLVSFVSLNIIFIFSCVPIVTIGSAMTSLYATTIKYIDNEDIPLTKSYLRAFKKNIKSGTITFLICVAFIGLLAFNLSFWWHFKSVVSSPIIVVLLITMFIAVLVTEFVFPLIARYQNSVRQSFKNAFLITVENFFKGLLLIAIDSITIAIFYFSNFARVMILMFGFAFVAYLKSFVLSKVFARYSEK